MKNCGKKLLAALLAAAGPSAVLAQSDRDSDDARGSYGYDSITVTALRKEETLAEVPVTVTVFDRNALETRRVTEQEDFLLSVPGVNTTGAGTKADSFTFIRGVGSVVGRPTVVTQIDGVAQGIVQLSNQTLIDLEQVEVVKGPQGTLYGRNALGGVINITTRKPNMEEFEGFVRGEFGEFGHRVGQARLSGPLIENELAASATFSYSNFDGFTPYADITGIPGELEEVEELTGRVRLLWEPADSLSFDLTGYYSDIEDYSVAFVRVPDNQTFDAEALADFRPDSDRQLGSVSLRIVKEFDAGALTSTTAYQFYEQDFFYDQDYASSTNPALFQQETRRDETEQTQISQEIRFDTSFGDRFDVSVGGFLFYDEISDAATTVTDSVFGVETGVTAADIDTLNLAGFLNVSYDITQDFEVSFGARVDYEETEVNSISLNQVEDTSNTEFLPRVGFRWLASDSLTVYGSVARGYKSGGFNAEALDDTELEFEPETIWAQEIGVRGSFADGRGTYNIAAFAAQQDDVQAPFNRPFPVFRELILTQEGAETYGVDVEVGAQLTDWLRGQLAYNYTRSELDPFFDDFTQTEIGGRQQALVPEHSWSAMLDFNQPISSEWNLIGNLAYRHQDDTVIQPTLPAGFFGGDGEFKSTGAGFDVVDLSIGVRSERIEVQFFVTNLFDDEYFRWFSDFTTFDAFFVGAAPMQTVFDTQIATYGQPRMLGGSVKLSF